MPEAEDMLSASGASENILDQRRFDLALQLTEQYRGLLSHWMWGDSVLEWIRQCEITFECEATLGSCCIRTSGRMPAARVS